MFTVYIGRAMKIQHKVIALSIILGIIVSVADSVMHSFLFHEGSIWDVLILDVPAVNVYMRAVAFASVVIFGALISIVLDRRERAEAARQESETSYRILFENIPIGVGIANYAGILLAFNDAMLKPSGYTRADIDRMGNVGHLYFDPSDRDRALTLAAKQGFLDQYEVRFRRKDGTSYDALLSLRPVRFRGQQCWQAMVEDITERKTAETQIKERNQELTALREVGQAVSGSLDLDAVAAQALEVALKVLGMDAGAVRYLDETTQEQVLLCHLGLPEEMVRERQARPRVKIGESLAGRVAQSGETLVVDNFSQDSMSVYETNRTSGFDFFVGLPLKVKGKVVGVISGLSRHRRTFGTDDMELMADLGSMVGMAIANARLFEQVKAAEREREVERMKREFIAVASHELRTPMTGVYGFAELLLNSKGLDEVQREWVGRIYKGSQRTIKIIADMLNVSRIDSGLISLKMEAVTLAPIIAGLTIQLSPRYTSHSFRMDIPDGFTEVWADADRLTEVLHNLMDNAAKFSPEGGRVEVTAHWDEERSQAVIAVTDWGVGIPEAEVPRLFERFSRVQRPETEGIPGTGLGLHMAKSLVDIMQGRIWVESRENEGSTFYVALPVPKGQEPATPPAS